MSRMSFYGDLVNVLVHQGRAGRNVDELLRENLSREQNVFYGQRTLLLKPTCTTTAIHSHPLVSSGGYSLRNFLRKVYRPQMSEQFASISSANGKICGKIVHVDTFYGDRCTEYLN